MMKKRLALLVLAASAASVALAAPAPKPWMDRALGPDVRASRLLGQMTREEKLTLVFGYFATDFPPKSYTMPKEGREGSAGYVPGIPRLGIPPQWQTDAGVGVASQGGAKQ
jgi:beta-glucosidase